MTMVMMMMMMIMTMLVLRPLPSPLSEVSLSALSKHRQDPLGNHLPYDDDNNAELDADYVYDDKDGEDDENNDDDSDDISPCWRSLSKHQQTSREHLTHFDMIMFL